MALADALTTARSDSKNSASCGVDKILRALPKLDKETLAAALVDYTYTAMQIVRALKKEGHTVSGFLVRRHRRTECSCYRGEN